MILFLDSSVLVAASASSTGASREIVMRSAINDWTLLSIPYVLQEVTRNLVKFPPQSAQDWDQIRPRLAIRDNVLTSQWPVLFNARKDRPILFSALAYAHVLLTLDRADFAQALGRQFYGLDILTPSDFLARERRNLK